MLELPHNGEPHLWSNEREQVTTTEITTVKVLEVLNTLKAQKGDYTQPRFQNFEKYGLNEPKIADPSDLGSGSCRYGDPITGGPSCIVGWAIFTIDRSLFHTIAENSGSADILLDDLERNHGVTVEMFARKLLTKAQAEADDGNTWGQSISHALSTLI